MLSIVIPASRAMFPGPVLPQEMERRKEKRKRGREGRGAVSGVSQKLKLYNVPLPLLQTHSLPPATSTSLFKILLGFRLHAEENTAEDVRMSIEKLKGK